ncbi:MAG: hypothetical protein KJP12_02305 [Acidimicrobiia bacterium]|nr:hypothetical protein [Acidimicrobiia bacterium]NNF68609.1 hypothetical protein [Acidimicrobiia bacterium]NNK91652.1 hypothetical protein [Acidimicrobiia bacterium]
MVIDCASCAMQHTQACDDCIVTVLIDGGPLTLDSGESVALENLADAGLVAPIRLVPLVRPDDAATG